MQRRVITEPRHRRHVGAGVDQHLRLGYVAAARRPVQRRHAVTLSRIDVGAFPQERAYGVGVSSHGRIGDR